MLELVASPKQRQFGLEKRDTLPVTASSATSASPATAAARETDPITMPDGEPGLNYLCPGFKDFFHHADRPIRIMGTRAPAEDAKRGPQKSLHLRLGAQMEALPRRPAFDRIGERNLIAPAANVDHLSKAVSRM